MLTRIAVLLAVCVQISTTAQAQTESTGTTSGATSSTGSNSSTGTLSSTPVGQGQGAVTSEIQSSTVETSRTSGLSGLNTNSLGGATGGTTGQQTLPGGSQLGRNTQQSSQRGQAGRASSTRTIRPSLRLGFTPLRRPSQDVSRAVRRSFLRLAIRSTRIAETNPALSNVTIVAGKSGALTLQGSVPTRAARRLAENILRMEPGVRKIQNDLTVATASPNSQAPPASAR
ncbi:MAG: BON domain-containing protein [Planctomycetaceae bacterium]